MLKAFKGSDNSESASENPQPAKPLLPAEFDDADLFLSSKQLCERLHLSYSRLKTWTRKGYLPFIRPPGGRVMIFYWPSTIEALRRLERVRQQ